VGVAPMYQVFKTKVGCGSKNLLQLKKDLILFLQRVKLIYHITTNIGEELNLAN